MSKGEDVRRASPPKLKVTIRDLAALDVVVCKISGRVLFDNLSVRAQAGKSIPELRRIIRHGAKEAQAFLDRFYDSPMADDLDLPPLEIFKRVIEVVVEKTIGLQIGTRDGLRLPAARTIAGKRLRFGIPVQLPRSFLRGSFSLHKLDGSLEHMITLEHYPVFILTRLLPSVLKIEGFLFGIKTCPNCGSLFIGKRSDKLTCSPACKMAARRKRP